MGITVQFRLSVTCCLLASGEYPWL